MDDHWPTDLPGFLHPQRIAFRLSPSSPPRHHLPIPQGVVDLSHAQMQRLKVESSTRLGRVPVTGGTGSATGSCRSGAGRVGPAVSERRTGMDTDSVPDVQVQETVRVHFKADEWVVADHDVVLTTYEMLRSKPALFRKVMDCFSPFFLCPHKVAFFFVYAVIFLVLFVHFPLG